MADEAEIGAEQLEGWALAYLGHYASSAANLRRVLLRRLRRRRSDPDPGVRAPAVLLVDALIERYQRSGLLDDAAYATARAHTLQRRGESTTRIRARLAASGIENSLITTVIGELRADRADLDLAAACIFARRRRLGPYRRGPADPARDLGAFARAGFSRTIAVQVLACADIAAVEALVGTTAR
ncbi:MAG TPA: RecX family transcriptional regulator [Stellaceae bacterium]|nr:RecX family transcriptional regulator [Stellaceae bacterium]